MLDFKFFTHTQLLGNIQVDNNKCNQMMREKMRTTTKQLDMAQGENNQFGFELFILFTVCALYDGVAKGRVL